MTIGDRVYAQAISRLRELVDEATRRGEPDASSAALATASASGAPSVRTIDVFRLGVSGAVFFANAHSGKAFQLRENPRAALCWYWPQLRYQAVMEGAAELLADDEADACWNSQTREKQLGGWASEQSQPLQDEAGLRRAQDEVQDRFRMERVPRPAGWCAFQLVPSRIVIWQTGWKRLHAKRIYERGQDGSWSVTEVGP